MRRALCLPLLVLACSGCGLGLYQTAKTTPPGTRRYSAGLTATHNHTLGITDRGEIKDVSRTSLQPEFGVRVGLAERTDLGVGMYLGPGLRADVKHNLIDNQKPYALALRGGLGGSKIFDQGGVFSWLAGVIGSYHLASFVSPYAGVTFTDHYIWRSSGVFLGPGEQLAPRSYLGDGLLQLTAGFELGSRRRAYLEYSLLVPVQNDPGDQFRFVTSHLVGLSLATR